MASLRTRSLLACALLIGCSSSDAPPARETPSDDEGASIDDSSNPPSAARDASVKRDASALDAGIVAVDARDASAPSSVDGSSIAASVDASKEASTPASSRLPAVEDLSKPGPFTATSSAGPSGYVLFFPQQLGQDGVRHPIFSWGPGAVETASSFTTLLNHIASHGFVVISYDGTPDGAELTKGIDWLVAENEREGSTFYQKLDSTKIAMGGHSAGSLATFKVAKDARLTTTLHLCGGTFDPHTDIANLHAPALFLCGENGGDGLIAGDVARPNCDIDFMNAKVPVTYGNPKGAAHMSPTEIGDATLRMRFASTCVGWLRWQLAGDESLKTMFVGDDCTLCKDAQWTVQQKNWM